MTKNNARQLKTAKYGSHKVKRFTSRIVQSTINNRQSTIRNSRGFAYIALLVVMVIIGISLGAAGKYWQNVVLRDKEEELLFRGDQYRQAIERYYFAVPGRPQYPKSLEELLADGRLAGRRHLRRKYQDPLTGEDFEILTNLTVTAGVPVPAQLGAVSGVTGIVGVHSKSDREPLKKGGFPEQYPDFAGKGAYSDWRFVTTIKAVPPGLPPGQSPLSPRPGPVGRRLLR